LQGAVRLLQAIVLRRKAQCTRVVARYQARPFAVVFEFGQPKSGATTLEHLRHHDRVLTNAIAMYLDQFLPPDPVQIGQYRDLTLFAEGQGFALPRVRTMLVGDANRYSDLCGRTVGLVMPLLDWSGRDLPFCITACNGDEVVAAAWAGTITSRETGAIGCNVSYGVRPDFAGRGLATILSAIAYQQCAAKEPMLEFVNVQTEAGNDSAQAVADRLLLARAPSFDRKTSGAAPRLYVTYRSPEHLVAARCVEILAAAGIDVSQAFQPARAARSLKGVQPRFPLHPSIAALLPPPKGSTMSHSPTPAAAAPAAASSATSKARVDNDVLRNALAGPHGLLPGIALVEEQLAVARRALAADAPFPLTPAEAQLHHSGASSAYTHSLEMVSSDFLRELHTKLAPIPPSAEANDQVEAALMAQNAALTDALFGKYGVTSGALVIEKCLETASRAEHVDAPFPLDHAQAALWHRAQQTAYLYVLEMLCTDSLKCLEPRFPMPADRADPAAAADDEPAPAPAM